jgi:hypothetical protein
MSWTEKAVGRHQNITLLSETYTLPASATIGYSSVIEQFSPDFANNDRNIAVSLNASAVSGTNLDIALYGSDTLDGADKFPLKDALVADITATGWVTGPIDLNEYPAAYYFIAWTADADESANTIEVKIMG